MIGSDGFGYFSDEENKLIKVNHRGGVVIGNDVEIGANTCIDRGTIGDTIIGSNTKIDNLVHIAHNVIIGNSVCVVAGSIICGSAILDDYSYVAPGGIIKNQIKVEKNAMIGLGAVVNKQVRQNKVVIGVPAKEIRDVGKGDK